MAVTIDELQIEIQAKGAESANGIDALTTSLAALKKMVNKTLTNKLGELSSALDKIKAPITVNMNVKGMEELKKAVADASKAVPPSISPDVSPQIDGGTPEEFKRIQSEADGASSALKRFADWSKRVWDKLLYMGRAAKYAGGKIGETGDSAKKGASGLSKFADSLKRIALYRFVRYILKSITSAMREGIQNLAQYSKAIGGIDASRANETMSKFSTAALQVKNSIGAALMPVLKTLMPVIQTLAGWFITAANAVNQFFAAISGASTWSRAKEYAVDYAEGLNKAGGAASDLKNAMLGIDELNVISPNSGGGGGGAGALDYGDMFEEAEIGENISKFAEKIIPVLQWVRENFDTILETVAAIGGVLLGWKIAKTVLSFFGMFTGGGATGFSVASPKTVLTGLADLALIIGGITGIVVAVGALTKIPGFDEVVDSGIESLKTVFSGIASIALPLAGMTVGVALLGKIGIRPVLEGLAGMAGIIGGTTLVITAIGAVMSIPTFETFLATGITSMQKAFNGIREIILPLSIVTGLVVALGLATPAVVLSGLAGLALVIGGFELVMVAIGGLHQIPGFTWIVEQGTNALINMGEKLGEFVGAFIAGKQKKMAEALPEIGKKLSEFAPYMVSYSNSMKGVDSSIVEKTSLAALSIVEFARKIPGEGGVTSWFLGDRSIDKWGKKLPSFGKYFKQYSDNMKGVDTGVVKNSSDAAQSIVNFASNIPAEGGVKSWFMGNNNIDVWGAKLPAFGKHFKAYSDNIKGVDNSVVLATSAAAQSIVELAGQIPKEGGFFSLFVGDKGIDKFGEKLSIFGGYFLEYFNQIKQIGINTLSQITNGINAVIDFSVRIKDEVDNGAIDKFSRSLRNLGDTIRGLPPVKNVGVNIVSGGTAQQKFTAFASGGFPAGGQMFVAREAGPEMVGTIGGRTAVANNDQIVQAVSEGVYEAVVAAMSRTGGEGGSSVNVYLDGKQINASVRKTQREKGAGIMTSGVVFA